MKANRLGPALSFACVVAAAAALAGCAAERRAPQPTPAPSPTATRPVSTPAPAPRPIANWRDAPITPGLWLYRAEPAGSAALFGPGGGNALLALRCERAGGQVTLARAGAAQGSVPLSVTTTNGTRAFSATAQGGIVPQLTVALAPRDPLLDAIAFSRGRFAVEAPGLPPLYLPAWPEVARVIEDCR